MHHAAHRGVHKRIRNLQGDVDRIGDRQAARGFDLLPDGHSFDVLEGDVMVRAVLTDAVDPRDVLVIELRGGAPLLVEARDDFGVAGLIGGQELERDLAVELGIECAKNRPHAADADGFFDQERVDKIARHRQGCRQRQPWRWSDLESAGAAELLDPR